MTKIQRQVCGVAAMLAALALQPANATIVPAPLFTDNAVLQQKLPIPVWGAADAKEPITVAINGQTAKTVADASGAWSVKLSPIAAGGPYTLTITGTPNDTVTLNNILVGEVWICGGQSNMEFPLSRATTYATAQAAANDPLLRYANVVHTVGLTPQKTVSVSWTIATPDTVGRTTAIGYFFARDLRAALKVPVGIINDNWGGTPAQAWTSKESLEAVPCLHHYLVEEDLYPSSYPLALLNYDNAIEKYNENKTKLKAALEAAKAAGTPPPALPQPPRKPDAYDRWPGGAAHLYNGMIAPVAPYGIRGAIWYQGEANGGSGYEYKTLFPTMISDWRKTWGEGDFPFLFVQLAPYMAIKSEPLPKGANGWPDLREAQRATLSILPNTGMAVITDLGNSTDIHPRRKEPVGDRLALIALAQTYGQNVEYSGPVFDGIKVERSKVRVRFTHASGLKTIDVHDGFDDGPIVAPAAKLAGFEVAGKDGVYYAADTAAIDGNAVVVSSSSVKSPVAVRYGWANYPIANLSNGAGLPASPFKSDNWPWASAPKDQKDAAK
ncbi:MAG: sialate O-acetylesterase [Capsulimonadaceae bacterium]|nr:sialate O-acetylesterase [Capsulimonadaceae bacterium]